MLPLLQWQSVTCYIFWECLLPLVPSMRYACAILSFAARPAVQNFSTLSHKRHDTPPPPPSKVIEHRIFFYIFTTKFVWNVSHSKKNLATYYHKWTEFFMRITRCFCQISMKLEFFGADSRKILRYQSSWTSVHWEPSFSVRTDGRQTDMTKLMVV